MEKVSKERVRQFRLRAHHLDKWYQRSDLMAAAGACGLQNSPPGAWETALHNRIPGCGREELRRLLEVEKTLLQAWSFRGAPVVFPTAESGAFLSALVSREDEPWIYTRGIQLALDFLEMSFEEALLFVKQAMPGLVGRELKSKTELDQTLADWVLPLLPAAKKELWSRPSMYGNPEKQTVGGAVVSFLSRPCSFMGLVVFGQRMGVSPTFTAYESWIGSPLEPEDAPESSLARKYLRCFGPGTAGGLADWLGCGTAQAERIWHSVAEEIEPVSLSGKTRYILAEDKELLLSPPPPERQAHLLGGHDPYLDLRDREVILEDKARQRLIWQTVSNPGAVLWQGGIAGLWKPRKKGRDLEIEVSLWDAGQFGGRAEAVKQEIRELAERYALFQGLRLNKIAF